MTKLTYLASALAFLGCATETYSEPTQDEVKQQTRILDEPEKGALSAVDLPDSDFEGAELVESTAPEPVEAPPEIAAKLEEQYQSALIRREAARAKAEEIRANAQSVTKK